jgi:NAD(P)H dehydrogenase (quinone)
VNISVILAHPDPRSFNHAIAHAVVRALKRNRHRVWLHDLHAERFDPVLRATEAPKGARLDARMKRYCRELADSDGIVIVHPNWWGQPPALLKGWVDRVVRPGVAYEFREGDSGDGVPVGLLKARTAVVFNTSNTPARRERAAFGDPLDALWRKCIFQLCGVKRFRRRMFGVVVTSTAAQRRRWLAEAAAIVERSFPARRRP